MDKIKAWLDDKKNMPILIAGAAVFVIILVFVVFKAKQGGTTSETAGAPGTQMAGPGGANGMTAGGAGSMKSGLGMGAGAPGARMGAGTPGAAMTPGMGPGMTPGMGAGMAGMQQASTTPAAAAGPAVSTAAVLKPMLPYRKDPFVPFSGAPTRSTIIRSMLPQVSHYEFPRPVKPISLPGMVSITRQDAPETLPPQPFRRMAGVLIDGRVSAIMETNGESDIVVPGMEVTRGNSRVRVESITSEEIILKTLDTKRPIKIRVNLSGAVVVPTATTNSTMGGGVQRMPGMSAISPVQ